LGGGHLFSEEVEGREREKCRLTFFRNSSKSAIEVAMVAIKPLVEALSRHIGCPNCFLQRGLSREFVCLEVARL